jgi:CubicO group peptidase (beta-lactamase class C family)
MSVGGWVAPGFESVLTTLEAHAAALAPGGAAFAAAVRGEMIVDVWTGQARINEPWQPDTVAVLLSASKGLTTLAAQVLYDRGQLELDRFVADYWPEFGMNGKERVTVRHILTHSAGLVGLDSHTDLLAFDGSGFNQYDEIARRLAAARPDWEPGTRHGYHASTFGWLVGELVRRITGRSLGTYFHEEIAKPLGLDLHIGTRANDHARVAAVMSPPAPDLSGPEVARSMAWLRDPHSLGGKAFFARDGGNILDHVAALMNSATMLEAELGAGNATGSARSLARMYAVHAMGGELEGVRGFGGQIGGVDLTRGLSFGFVRNRLENHSGFGAVLVDRVVNCL